MNDTSFNGHFINTWRKLIVSDYRYFFNGEKTQKAHGIRGKAGFFKRINANYGKDFGTLKWLHYGIRRIFVATAHHVTRDILRRSTACELRTAKPVTKSIYAVPDYCGNPVEPG
jgi:hypothetical protein